MRMRKHLHRSRWSTCCVPSRCEGAPPLPQLWVVFSATCSSDWPPAAHVQLPTCNLLHLFHNVPSSSTLLENTPHSSDWRPRTCRVFNPPHYSPLTLCTLCSVLLVSDSPPSPLLPLVTSHLLFLAPPPAPPRDLGAPSCSCLSDPLRGRRRGGQRGAAPAFDPLWPPVTGQPWQSLPGGCGRLAVSSWLHSNWLARSSAIGPLLTAGGGRLNAN